MCVSACVLSSCNMCVCVDGNAIEIYQNITVLGELLLDFSGQWINCDSCCYEFHVTQFPKYTRQNKNVCRVQKQLIFSHSQFIGIMALRTHTFIYGFNDWWRLWKMKETEWNCRKQPILLYHIYVCLLSIYWMNISVARVKETVVNRDRIKEIKLTRQPRPNIVIIGICNNRTINIK